MCPNLDKTTDMDDFRQNFMFFDENHLQDLVWLNIVSSRVDKEVNFRDYNNLQLCSFFFFSGLIWLSWSFTCPYTFYNFFVYFFHKCPQDFDRDGIEFVNCFR